MQAPALPEISSMRKTLDEPADDGEVMVMGLLRESSGVSLLVAQSPSAHSEEVQALQLALERLHGQWLGTPKAPRS